MRHTAYGWWIEEAGAVDPAPPLGGDVAADVVVVGGGYTGLWAAWYLAEAGAEVALVEAGLCGHGPSGRNGGFANSLWRDLPELRRRLGDAAALRVADASARSVVALGEWCESEGVDAWYRRGGHLRVSTAPAQDGRWREGVAACAELGHAEEFTELTPAEVRERCGSPVFRGGALLPLAATVQPARLALGLRRRLLEVGVRLFERSPVRRLLTATEGVTAETGPGRVRAPAAVLASGAWAVAARPLARRLTVGSSHIVLTEPVPDVIEELGWSGGECITDQRTLLHYFRTTNDGRILFGWGGGHAVMGGRISGTAHVDPGVVGQTARDLTRIFPQLERRRIEHAWGGPIDISPTHLPFAGTLPGGRVHHALGYTGNGVAPSHMLGRALASMALGRRDEHSALPLVEPPVVRVPPEPFRYLGGEVVRAAMVRKERAEEDGGSPDPISRAVAAVPGMLGWHVGR